jgi:L-lysine 2,3-aminomutase
LNKKIAELKRDFNANMGEILRTERELNKITDDAMKEEISKMRNFEQLNSEKITPYFLSLAKKSNNSESLVDICKDDGSPFESVSERNNYIYT